MKFEKDIEGNKRESKNESEDDDDCICILDADAYNTFHINPNSHICPNVMDLLCIKPNIIQIDPISKNPNIYIHWSNFT